MGNTVVSITPQEKLRNSQRRRDYCMRNYDRSYVTISRLRTAVQTAGAQQEWTMVEEQKHALRNAEVRLARLERG